MCCLIYTEEQAEIIIKNDKNLINRAERNPSNLEIRKIQHGGSKNGNLTMEERIVIGSAARAGLGTHQELANEFGVSKSAVDNYSVGLIERAGNSDASYSPGFNLKEGIEKQLSPIRERAIEKLIQSLDVITPEKLDKLKPKDASIVASNMSKILSNTLGTTINDNRVQIVMYGPEQKKLKEFEVVEV